jgi:hypothetical protein
MSTVAERPARSKPARKPIPRTIALELAATEVSRFAVVRVTEGKKIDRYSVTSAAADYGPAFTVHKLGTDDEYAVNLDPAHASCECKGWCRWKKCRHVAGLRALLQAGKL